MLNFILGIIVGSFISFFVLAICRMAGTDDRTDAKCTKNIGDSDARK
jgi:hypothetical protein